MQTLKLCVSLPDASHSDMEVRLSTNDSDCEIVIALPLGKRIDRTKLSLVNVTSSSAGSYEYELGGYAGI